MHIDSTRKSSEGVCPDRRHRSLLQKSRSVLAAVYSSGVLSRARAKQVAIPPSNNGQQRSISHDSISPSLDSMGLRSVSAQRVNHTDCRPKLRVGCIAVHTQLMRRQMAATRPCGAGRVICACLAVRHIQRSKFKRWSLGHCAGHSKRMTASSVEQ